MKKNYSTPEIIFVELTAQDLLFTSGLGDRDPFTSELDNIGISTFERYF